MTTNPTRPVLRYFGGKWRLAPWIISHFPPHRIYVEPFGGGASVLLRKERAWGEIYNDLDGEVVNIFTVVRDNRKALEDALRSTPYSRHEFDIAQSRPECADPVERARQSIIMSFMGHGADSLTRGYRTGFRAKVSIDQNGHPAADWAAYPDGLAAIEERLAGVVIENRDALEVMSAQDSVETLHFVDPPYVHSTRGGSKWGKHGYRHEMTDEQHVTLCDFLKSLKGMVILCGYRNEIYDRMGWHSVECAAHADGARDRTEVLWLNPAAMAAQNQMGLF